MKLHWLYILVLGTFLNAAGAATIALQRQGSAVVRFGAEAGARLEMEVFIDAEGEELSGYAFFIAFDSSIFRLIPFDQDNDNVPEAFLPGDFFGANVLLNRIEDFGGETFISYAEAAGVQRQSASGAGVAARFRVEVLRRPPGDLAFLRVETRGHDRSSHFTTLAAPGVERRFAAPLGVATVRIGGFRILPLPDVELIQGEEKRVFDLDDFVDQEGAQVLWTSSKVEGISTRIDAETSEVRMRPEAGLVGRRRMIFTALEVGEGLTAADTIDIDILARPLIADFPDSVVFAEDGAGPELNLEALGRDLDNGGEALRWSSTQGANVQVEIGADHIARFGAAADWFGAERIRFTVMDASGLADTASTLVVVTPVNDPPEALKTRPLYPVQGGAPLLVPLAALVEDRDDALDRLSFELSSEGPVQAKISGANLEIEGLAPGRAVVRYGVRDAEGARARGRQVAVVLAPGASVAPKILPLPSLRFVAGQVGVLDLKERAQDDSPAAELNWTAAPDSGLRALIDEQRILQLSAAAGFEGVASVLLRLGDAQGNQDSVRLEVDVLGPEQRRGPRIQAPGRVGLVAGGEVALSLDELVDDPGGSDAEIRWTPFAGEGLELEFDQENRILRLRAPRALAGPAGLRLRAEDAEGNSDEVAVPVLVARPDGPPLLSPLAPVVLDSVAAQARLDLDAFVFDGEDLPAELVWEAAPGAGLEGEVDPVTHLLRLRRVDAPGGEAPETTQVLLKVRDTSGQEASLFLPVELPPVFALKAIPDIMFFAGGVDTSLVLDDFVVFQGSAPQLRWTVRPAQNLEVSIDAQSSRVRLESKDPAFQGGEVVLFTAEDQTRRSRTAALRVVVKSRGLTPQLRPFPSIEVRADEVHSGLDLDEFVVDDDADAELEWSVGGLTPLGVEIDTLTHVVTLSAAGVEPGVQKVRFAVSDPAGNTALGILEVRVLRGGLPPRIEGLPQLVLAAGGAEERLSLDAFVSDEDTPDSEIAWEVLAGSGIAARIEARRLFVSVPPGQRGRRRLELRARDPQGNEDVAELLVEIQTDEEPPSFVLKVRRNPVFGEELEVEVRPSEVLARGPEVRFDGASAPVAAVDESTFVAARAIDTTSAAQRIDLEVSGADAAGNEGRRRVEVALRWMVLQGGTLHSPDMQLRFNVADGAAGPGRVALIHRLDEREAPPGSEGRPVYAVDLVRGRELDEAVTLSFPAGGGAAGLGILHWDDFSRQWEEVPSALDEGSGRISALVRRLGLFRLGEIEDPANLRPAQKLMSYPNPFPTPGMQTTQIVYKLAAPGPVRLEIFNVLGQSVKLLVDENFQDAGVWSASWDGRDRRGEKLASGMYFYELREGGRRHHRALLLVR